MYSKTLIDHHINKSWKSLETELQDASQTSVTISEISDLTKDSKRCLCKNLE